MIPNGGDNLVITAIISDIPLFKHSKKLLIRLNKPSKIIAPIRNSAVSLKASSLNWKLTITAAHLG